MTTILIWLGSGFAFSVGVIVGVKVFIAPSRSDKDRDEYNRQSVNLMQERNELDAAKVEKLNAICHYLEAIATAQIERKNS